MSTKGTPSDRPSPCQPAKPQRVLACLLCQQRKTKCNRKFPCENCIKSRAQCVPATQVSRQRRRRFPERELLERLRNYEDLLRQNRIKFEPLHKDLIRDKDPSNLKSDDDSEGPRLRGTKRDWPSPSATATSEGIHESKNIWHAMSQGFRDPEDDTDSSDDLGELVVQQAWDDLFESNDHLLFGSRTVAVDISSLHPEPAQIFRLWHIYLEHVNPLLKVTHTPTLQGLIVEAINNIAVINPTLEALMFSIYCTAIMSLSPSDVLTRFGSSKEDLLSSYHFGCQQALLNCGFLRCDNRNCLTALYLYLVSVRASTVPRSLSSMLGAAIRIAKRMGIHKESELVKCNALEAEMRRRLWWSLVLFDARIGEMADSKATELVPTWDCHTPLNLNDSDLRAEMKEPPQVLEKSTEALFAVVRAETGDFIRNSSFYLDFAGPSLKLIAKDVQNGPVPEGGELVTLRNMIEDKYLKFCDPENPLHFMTIWSTRAFLAKYHLIEYHSRYLSSLGHQSEAERDAAFFHALNLLECDTKLMGSPLTQGFIWLVHFYFPFPAYIQIVQALKRQPTGEQATQAWEIMANNYEIRFGTPFGEDLGHSPLFHIFANLILRAWQARDAAFKQIGEPLRPPEFVSSITLALGRAVQNDSAEQPHDFVGMDVDEFLMSMPIDIGSGIYSWESQIGYEGTGSGIYPIPAPFDVNLNQLDWSAMK